MYINEKVILIFGLILILLLGLLIPFSIYYFSQNNINEHQKVFKVDMKNNYVGFFENAPNLLKDYDEYNQEYFDKLYEITGRIGLKKLKQHSDLVIGQGVHVDGYFIVLVSKKPSKEVMRGIYELYEIECKKDSIDAIAVAFQIFKITTI